MTAIVGNDVIFATSATLGGHCEIGDFVYIGGLSAVHQFTRVGSQVMIGGVCGVRDDIIPFGLVNGQYAVLEGLNIIGMRRRKFTKRGWRRCARSIRSCSTVPGSLPNAWRRCGRSPVKIRRSPKSSTFIERGKLRPLCLPADREVRGMAASMTSAASGFPRRSA